MFKIVGKVQGIAYCNSKNDSNQAKNHYILLIPDQEYSVIVDGQKYAIFLPVDKNKNEAKVFAYNKYISIKLEEDINQVIANSCGCILEIQLDNVQKCNNNKEDEDISVTGAVDNFILLSNR